jgi:polysaccharide biosynthesis/export protein
MAVAVLAGCEVDSYLDMSEVGRYERTPTILPILNQLDIIDEPSLEPAGMTEVMPADLIPQVQEYVIGAGDVVQVTVYELLLEATESVQQRRVDNLGMIRLPVIGPVKAGGSTPTELENEIRQILVRRGVLREPTVNVDVVEERQNTFSIIGEPRTGGTALGTYAILKEDFRLLDAIALARGVPGNIRNIFIYRPVELYEERPLGQVPQAQPGTGAEPAPSELLQQLMEGQGQAPAEAPHSEAQAPAGLEPSVEEGSPQGAWVNVGGRWVRSGQPRRTVQPQGPGQGEGDDVRSKIITQRIIQVPYDNLLRGDMRYNVVIRPGDIINIPAPNIGNVYVMGQISRPGVYGLPGDGDLTIKNVVAAGGNLAPLAVPERVDLIRRIERDREAWVRLDVRAIFDGTQPDIFLKPNDQLVFGTNFAALPVQVIRSGFRMTYGFGFVLDRNFAGDVFGALKQ